MRTARYSMLMLLGLGCGSREISEHTATNTQALIPTVMSVELEASVAQEFKVQLIGGTQTVFKTIAASSGADPILNLFAPDGSEVAADDNGAGDGKNARIVFTAPSTHANYRLVVRAASATSGGVCKVLQNGTAIASSATFSGGYTELVGLRANETLETVLLPNGAESGQFLYVLKPDNIGIEKRVIGTGTSGGALATLTSDLGTRNIVSGVRTGTKAGKLRLVRNDAGIAGHDQDADGLGDELETFIGTCSTLTGTVTSPNGAAFDCSQATDPRDTDGDGINDAWEFLGRRDLNQHQALPKWGASPRHKDIFLELDFMQRCDTEDDSKMTAAIARGLADRFGDRMTDLAPAIALAHAATLRNPDQLPGIALHIDSGRPPETPEDAVVYGDWGGHEIVPAVPNPGVGCGFKGQNAGAVWTTRMNAARRGIFHYALGYDTGGGSNFEYRVFSNFNQAAIENSLHEFGHSLGFGHSGRAGDTVADPNCKPAYSSLMNYAYYDHSTNRGFSDGTGRAATNNLALQETDFTHDATYLQDLSEVFKYNVDFVGGHVDWNRDGVFSSSPVRAYANFAPGGQGCEWTRYNSRLVAGAQVMMTPVFAHLGDRAYVLYPDTENGHLATSFTKSTDLNCPKVGDCANVTFSLPAISQWDATLGVAAARLETESGDQLLIVMADSQGLLWETRLSLVDGAEQWATPKLIESVTVGSEPALAADGKTSVHLAYRGTDEWIRTNHFLDGNWSGERFAKQVVGGPGGSQVVNLPRMTDKASPALAMTYIPGFSDRQLVGAFANLSGETEIFRFNPTTERWQITGLLQQEGRPAIRRKPAMAWVPSQADADFPGRFYFGYVTAGDPSNPRSTPKFRMSYVEGTGANQVNRFGLDSPFDNNTTLTATLSFHYEQGKDLNLRSVAAMGNGAQQLIIRPNADGITGHEHRNIDEWAWLGLTTCRTLIHPQNARASATDPALINPIVCRPFVFENN